MAVGGAQNVLSILALLLAGACVAGWLWLLFEFLFLKRSAATSDSVEDVKLTYFSTLAPASPGTLNDPLECSTARCGNLNRPGSRFCSICGVSLLEVA
jgi:hypothetical protein